MNKQDEDDEQKKEFGGVSFIIPTFIAIFVSQMGGAIGILGGLFVFLAFGITETLLKEKQINRFLNLILSTVVAILSIFVYALLADLFLGNIKL